MEWGRHQGRARRGARRLAVARDDQQHSVQGSFAPLLRGTKLKRRSEEKATIDRDGWTNLNLWSK